MSRHFAFVSMPAHGHINPTLPLVAELVGRGHRVSYATGASMLEAVRSAGAEPVEAPFVLPEGPPQFSGSTPPDPEDIRRRMQSFVNSVEQTYPVLVEHFGEDLPDAFCGDAMSPVTGLVAQKLDRPLVALNPSFASNEHVSLMNNMGDSPGARAAKAAFAGLGEQIDAFARSHGLSFGSTMLASPGELNLVFIPREFQLAADTFDDSFVFLGPSVGGRTGSDWQPRDPDAPLLLISLGTVFNARPEFFRLCAQAFGGSRWQVLMAVGDRIDPADLGDLPANVEVRAHVPQVQVLARADAFVTHNGMNSTMEALYFGVPQVGVPQMPEQTMNATRTEELGCGRRIDPATLDAAALVAAVEAVSTDPQVRRNCDRMRERLQAADGPATGADALEKLVG